MDVNHEIFNIQNIFGYPHGYGNPKISLLVSDWFQRYWHLPHIHMCHSHTWDDVETHRQKPLQLYQFWANPHTAWSQRLKTPVAGLKIAKDNYSSFSHNFTYVVYIYMYSYVVYVWCMHIYIWCVCIYIWCVHVYVYIYTIYLHIISLLYIYIYMYDSYMIISMYDISMYIYICHVTHGQMFRGPRLIDWLGGIDVSCPIAIWFLGFRCQNTLIIWQWVKTLYPWWT